MQDMRALANTKNLTSYRAWAREGQRRSGSAAILMIVSMLVPVFILAVTQNKPVTSDARDWVVLMGAVLALYLVISLGLSLLAVLRLNAWKRAHPWEPPPPR